MHTLRCILLVFLMISPLSLHAMTAVYWQPQDRDLEVSDANWQTLMQRVRKAGFDTLVVQWTRYGDSFSTQENIERLRQKVSGAQHAGLKIILGLYMDPEFFNRQKQPPAALINYLDRLRVFDAKQLQLWQDELKIKPDGWYISAEIDDLNWREQSVRQLMLQWLRDTSNHIKQHTNKPVYISSFFVGNMAPAAYRTLLEEIQTQGLNVWVQDGRGVNKLTENQIKLYLDTVFACPDQGVSAASGIVYEMFNTTSEQTFNAIAKPAADINALLEQDKSCPNQRLYFSLRYLPMSAGILEYRVN